MKRYVLDACSVIALLNDEEGADIVEGILKISANGKAEVHMHSINILEIYYQVERNSGKKLAHDFLSVMSMLPVKIIEVVNRQLIETAGNIKAQYRVSLADAIAVGTAIILDAVLISADHHELDVLKRDRTLQIEWFR